MQKKRRQMKPSRRELLAGLAAGAFMLSGAPLSRSEDFDLLARRAVDSEYMFEPGLIYLNTRTYTSNRSRSSPESMV
jgi:hypothetical protein